MMIKFVAVFVSLEGRSQCFGQFLFSVGEIFFKVLHKNRFQKVDASLLLRSARQTTTAPALSSALITIFWHFIRL